jgi:FG-GAP repeat/FlgD Ig-like domain/FG-GAP-like repeat
MSGPSANLPPGVSQDWLATVNQKLAASEYNVSGQPGKLQAPNRRQNLRTSFDELGIQLEPRIGGASAWRWRWHLEGWGRGGNMRAVRPSPPVADVARVEYRHEDLLEWYVNRPEGIEQGFVVDRAPAGTGPLCLVGEVSGDLTGKGVSEDTGGIDFVTDTGVLVLNYAELHAWDATGRELPGELVMADARLSIRIDDRDAVYPVTIDPMLTVPDWHVECEQGLSDFGNSVATAGDVNGDGYSDVIVGAMSLGTNHGGAYLYLGSALGLETDYSWHEYGEEAYNNMGQCVSTAGDVNGDGYDDIIIGEPFYTDDLNDQGRAYVYYGGPDGPAYTADWDVVGTAEMGGLGFSVSTAGDVNSDGYDDVIIGAYDESLAWVYHGSASGLQSSWSWRGGEGVPDTDFGYCVAAAGDVNGDGYDDVVVGAPYMHSGGTYGRVYVYHGSAAGVINSPQWHVGGPDSFSYFATTVAGAGDVNGDGFSDILVGAMIYSGDVSLEGRAYLYQGSDTGLSTTPDWTDEGGQNNSDYGYCVATAGDVNGDGYSDVLVTAKEYTNGQEDEGRVYLYLGNFSGLSPDPTWQTEGDEINAWYGNSAATAGDVNGDGFSDIIVGIPNYGPYPEYGRAVVFHGQSSAPRIEPGWVVEGDQFWAFAGQSVAGVGDVNGDGYDDVMVGVPFYDHGQANEGAAFLYLGTHAGISWLPAWWAEGNQVQADFGISVAGAGDVDGNGLPDILIGAPYYDDEFEDSGAAFLWLSVIGGGPTGTPDNASWSFSGHQLDAILGFSVAGAGDVNGDGYGDIIVGAPDYDRGTTDEGAAFVFHGSAGGPSTNYDWLRDTGRVDAGFGFSVASAGDMNGDGYSDVIVGAPTYDHPDDMEGLAFVYNGSSTGLTTGAPWWYAQGDGVGHQLGYSVASAGDVNADGYSDVIIGAPYYDMYASNGGVSMVWYGQSTPPTTGNPGNSDWQVGRSQVGANCGSSVASAGDVNGDGFSDIIVGIHNNDGSAGSNSGTAFIYLGTSTGVSLGMADWLVEGTAADASFGRCVASAGDVNGDGFSDVIVGAPIYSGVESFAGRAYLFYGNDSRGLARSPRQWHSDLATRLGPLGMSDSGTGFGISVRGRTPAGRGNVRVEYEVKEFGTAFNGTGTVMGDWTNTGAPSGLPGSVVDISQAMTGLSNGALVKWRARLHSDNPYFPGSPWLYPSWNGGGEMDLRLNGSSSTGDDGNTPLAAGNLRNFPNPFNPVTTFSYDLSAQVHVDLQVYDVRGRLVRHLVNELQSEGRQHAVWDGRDDQGLSLGSGTYFARLNAGQEQFTRKVLLLK